MLSLGHVIFTYTLSIIPIFLIGVIVYDQPSESDLFWGHHLTLCDAHSKLGNRNVRLLNADHVCFRRVMRTLATFGTFMC